MACGGRVGELRLHRISHDGNKLVIADSDPLMASVAGKALRTGHAAYRRSTGRAGASLCAEPDERTGKRRENSAYDHRYAENCTQAG